MNLTDKIKRTWKSLKAITETEIIFFTQEYNGYKELFGGLTLAIAHYNCRMNPENTFSREFLENFKKTTSPNLQTAANAYLKKL